MQIQIAVENGFEGKSIAWVLAHPGCFAYGANASEAILKVPQVLISYQTWISEHTDQNWLDDLNDFDVRLMESFEDYTIDDQLQRCSQGKGVGAWFQSDWKPLTLVEIQHGLKLLSWSREDLLSFVTDLSNRQLNQTFEGERWSIAGILEHIASAEIWYMDRLGLINKDYSDAPKDPFHQLKSSRERLNSVLPTLEGKNEVRGAAGEFWSPRKILRRAAWHEKDHIMHILRLLTLM